MTRQFLFGVLLTTVAFSQDTTLRTITSIGPHSIGESLQDWISLNHLNVAEICQQKLPKGVKETRESKESRKSNCAELLALLNGKEDGKDNVANSVSLDGSRRHLNDDPECRGYEWTFIGRKLAQLIINIPCVVAYPSIRPNIREEIGFLTQKYGPPQVIRNALFKGVWNMPDGTAIMATESIGSNIFDYSTRNELAVVFTSKTYLDKLDAERRGKANPYNK